MIYLVIYLMFSSIIHSYNGLSSLAMWLFQKRGLPLSRGQRGHQTAEGDGEKVPTFRGPSGATLQSHGALDPSEDGESGGKIEILKGIQLGC